MKPIQIISQDVFDKIRSRFQNLEMGDETGAVTIDPAEARFFDFDFVVEGNDLGRVSISLNDLGSLKIYYSQGITEGKDDTSKKLWYNFLKEMRQFAMRRLLRFDTRDIAKTNLDRNDFQYLASKGTEDEEMTQMNESRWSQKSTKKTSRAVKGTTEVIVRHNRSVDEMYPGARSQKKNIKAIFIQNRDGERFKYPFIHPAGAFAMAQHVDHGGVPHDPAGKAIMRMSEQIAQLQEFQRQVQHSQLHDDAMGIADKAHGRLMELRSMIEALGKRHHYESWIAEFNEGEDDGLMDLDPVTMEEYKSKFTQTNFKEELAQFFPLIHKIMQETDAINLEDYVGEGEECDKCHKDPCECDEEVKESVNEFDQFEEWAEAVEQGKLTDDQIAELKQALADLQVPLDLDTAYNFFNEFGIDDEDLENKLQQAKDLDPETDALDVFKLWAQESYPELLVALGMSGTEAPAEPAPAEVPAEQPAMEGKDHSTMMKEVAKIVKQFYNEDNPEVGPFRSEEGILLDVEKQISEMFGEEAGQQARKVAEAFMTKLTNEWQQRHGDTTGVADDGIARLKELANVIKAKVEGIGDRGEGGRDFNVNIMSAEGDYPDGSSLKTPDAEDWKQQYQQAVMAVKNAKTQQEYEAASDRASRIKDLLASKGIKVGPVLGQQGAAEGIGDRGEGGEDFNTNIMPAEDTELDELDQLRARVGTNIVNKTPRPGQTDLRNIPAGNLPGSASKFSDKDREDQPERLKAQMKASQGKHHTPNLPKEGKIADKLKAAGQKVLGKLGHGDDQDLIKDLQNKAGVPQTGKKPMATTNEEFERILKLSGLAK